MLSSKTFISLILGTVAYQGAADDLRDAGKIAPAATAKNPWGWVFAALLMLAIHAPARADLPCSGGVNSVARPIATTLQPNASAFNPDGRVEVTMQSTLAQTTDIYVRHSVGRTELFRAITRLQSTPSVVVGALSDGSC